MTVSLQTVKCILPISLQGPPELWELVAALAALTRARSIPEGEQEAGMTKSWVANDTESLRTHPRQKPDPRWTPRPRDSISLYFSVPVPW